MPIPSPHEMAEHDYKLVEEVLERLTAAPISYWHNAGAQVILRGPMMDSIREAMLETMREGHHPLLAIEVILGMHLELVFALGYELGEGPEHIAKCHCVGESPN